MAIRAMDQGRSISHWAGAGKGLEGMSVLVPTGSGVRHRGVKAVPGWISTAVIQGKL